MTNPTDGARPKADPTGQTMSRPAQSRVKRGAPPEEEPNAWERFEKAVHTLMKAGPQHRKPEEKPKPSDADRR